MNTILGTRASILAPMLMSGIQDQKVHVLLHAVPGQAMRGKSFLLPKT
ncbi:hypothetical protein [Metabacillus niabensis]|nr:hypothetical protein [Metabacillus niabensis]